MSNIGFLLSSLGAVIYLKYFYHSAGLSLTPYVINDDVIASVTKVSTSSSSTTYKLPCDVFFESELLGGSLLSVPLCEYILAR